ncbi:hypothetical protein [Pandoravirus japonicus]|uniref:Uncharacterized protein n=1 Tax=Pandoravirus japonicus TaxID=2823154 RepID=A0A811BS71_9VIRU|nr:hypothetical protein [Pandoravirus japonicus]
MPNGRAGRLLIFFVCGGRRCGPHCTGSAAFYAGGASRHLLRDWTGSLKRPCHWSVFCVVFCFFFVIFSPIFSCCTMRAVFRESGYGGGRGGKG